MNDSRYCSHGTIGVDNDPNQLQLELGDVVSLKPPPRLWKARDPLAMLQELARALGAHRAQLDIEAYRRSLAKDS
jgi:hypothetical protein